MPTLHWIGKDKVINHHMYFPFKVLDKIYGVGMTIDEQGNPLQENVRLMIYDWKKREIDSQSKEFY